MPLRMLIDGEAVLPENVALIGARNLDPPEVEFIEASGVHRGDDAVERALAGTDAVYVALDCDAVRAAMAGEHQRTAVVAISNAAFRFIPGR